MPSRKKPADDSATPAKKPARRAPAKKAAPAAGEETGVAKAPSRAKKTVPAEGGATKVGYDLIVVESPTKAKTINKYLGSGYRVLASYGHVRDLPSKGKKKGEEVTGIQIAAGWLPRYVVEDRDDGKGKGKGGGKSFNRRTPKDILEEIRKEASKANRVFLASDPDREGEAIAWHIADELHLPEETTFRIRFNEITRAAVTLALQNPEHIDMNRVKAQEARRILDRVVGYPLSSLLGKKVTQGLSAGRVQSVAVKLIVDREREIEAFVSEEYWKVTAMLAPEVLKVAYKADPKKSKLFPKKKGKDEPEPEAEVADAKDADAKDADAKDGETKEVVAAGMPKPPQGAFMAELAKWEGAEFKANNETTIDEVMAHLQTVPYTITKIEQKDSQQRPRPPFTTSTLQQDASQRLRFPTSRTMQIAQKLYEGVELGSEGQVALITYMRTDSTRVSDDALKMVRGHIQTTYGGPYLPAKANVYASGKSAQEAHEAVRPTDLSYTPARVQPHLQPEQLRLYTLIYNRFVASQMTPAVYSVTNVEVTAGKGLFKTQGKILKFDGFQKVLPPAKQEDKLLPAMKERDNLDKLDLIGSQHFTQPPDRFNEASLVRTLEKEGIGRPSTYSSIISVIQTRGYVEQRDRRFYATDIGKVVTDLLVGHFPKIMDLGFTAAMEENLDQIETAQSQYGDVLNQFWTPFSEALEKAQTDMPARKGQEIGKPCPRCGKPLVKMYSSKTKREFAGCAGYKDKENPCSYKESMEGEELKGPVMTDIACPLCGKMMVQREGKSGPFLGCSGYPECKGTMNLDSEGKPVQTIKATDYKCEKCDSPMILREGKTGPFLGCSAYPKCRQTVAVDADGKPVKPADTGIVCEKCQSKMIIKRGPRGPFLSCSAYPKCKTSKPMTPELREQLKDMIPAPAPKKPNIQIAEPCPTCGVSPMNVKSGWGGKPFLGCSTYPTCKGLMKVTPEIEEKIKAATEKAMSEQPG